MRHCVQTFANNATLGAKGRKIRAFSERFRHIRVDPIAISDKRPHQVITEIIPSHFLGFPLWVVSQSLIYTSVIGPCEWLTAWLALV